MQIRSHTPFAPEETPRVYAAPLQRGTAGTPPPWDSLTGAGRRKGEPTNLVCVCVCVVCMCVCKGGSPPAALESCQAPVPRLVLGAAPAPSGFTARRHW